uniref:Shroom family member 2 n=1 Tax=Anabas testudineus TaxID=64144 RepID=A0A7N6BJD7_ANATE
MLKGQILPCDSVRGFVDSVLCRKNDPSSRPQSWHSSKLTEEETEPSGRDAAPTTVWKQKYEARTKESSTHEDQDTQAHLTSQFSSANNMERLEHPSHSYPSGGLSTTKYISSTEPIHGPGGKRDSGFSCVSSGSSAPVHEPSTSGRKGTSTETIFFKGLQSEGPQQAERPRYLQPTLGNGGWERSQAEEQPACRVSVAGRPSISPVWQVPEKKAQSPPPPPPPLRSDSFAATKVFPYSEGPSGPTKSQRQTENKNQNSLRPHHQKTSEARRSFNPLPIKDFLHPNTAADHNHNQLHPHKLFSLSSSDIRQSHYSQLPAHQRQYSDEGPFYVQTRAVLPTKTQTVESYYRSLQDLPSNAFSRKHIRHSTAFMAGSATNPVLESGGHSRYYSLASKHSLQTAELQARQGKAEGWKGEPEKTWWTNGNQPGLPSFLKTNVKGKHSMPQSQMPYSENKERNGHTHLGNGLHYEHKASELSVQSCSSENTAKKDEGLLNDMKRHFPTHQSNDHKVSLSKAQDPWVPQEDHRISPLKTPLLHSLAQESRSLNERQSAATSTETSDSMATISGKANRRSDRYATTLRKEIQQKRAQLQKSRSAATLTCDTEAKDKEGDGWKSSEAFGVSFSNTYKDHLKEAQARVLQATSFQRRDLEPLGPEVSVVKTSNVRIRGRKRFTQAKRTHSFSEPDKIDKVGVEGEPQTGSFGERKKYFEGKPAFSRPVLKHNQGTNSNTDLIETDKPKEQISTKEPEESCPTADPSPLSLGHKQVLLEQQRLGTFAEYQATWNKHKKSSEVKTQGRYHSAENILETETEEKAICIHERSRSSPSADFCTQNIPSSWTDPQAQQSTHTTRAKVELSQGNQLDHSPHSALSVPRNEDLVLPNHKTKPNTNPSHTTLSSGPLSLSPNPGSEHPAQPLQTTGLLPPPRPHLGPQTTYSSQEFLTGAKADTAHLHPVSSSSTDTHHRATAQGSSETRASSPHLRGTPGPDTSKGVEESEQERAALSLPSDQTRSPSPHFSPLRLTDKPPAVSVQDDSMLRSDNGWKTPEVMDANSVVRKVPIRIVHTETSSHWEGRAYLQQNTETGSLLGPPPYITSLGAAECPASSLFSTYTRQDRGQAPAPVPSQESVPESGPAGAQHSEEDAKREELARDIMGRDKSLVDILDQSGRKTTMDLMEGLFPPEEKILEGAHQRRRTSAGSRLPTSSPRSSERRSEDVSGSAAASLVPSSSYYNTSAPKAELLIKMKDMQEQLEEQESEDELDVDLASKKQELISSLARKLEVLREARQSLQEDVEDNEALGREVEATVQRLCQPNQLDKFRMFVGDLDKVVSLLLSLSGRLARVENALNSLEDEAPPEEKQTLTEKRKLLMRQHEDAKELKENLDRRERLVSVIMEAHLDAESLDDYRHFVKMKSALIIEQRKLEDKIKLGEEQLKCLVDSLPLDQRPLL